MSAGVFGKSSVFTCCLVVTHCGLRAVFSGAGTGFSDTGKFICSGVCVSVCVVAVFSGTRKSFLAGVKVFSTGVGFFDTGKVIVGGGMCVCTVFSVFSGICTVL